MKVTTRPLSLSGVNVPRGCKLPADLPVPAHLVQAGWVVELPDELVELDPETFRPQAQSAAPKPKPKPEPKPEPEPEPEAAADDLDAYHVGGGWYNIDGQNLRKSDAEQRLREQAEA